MAQNITPNFLVPGSGYIEKLKAGTNVTLNPISGEGAEVEVSSAGAVGPPGPPGAGGAIAYHIDAYTASNQLNNSGPSLPNAVEWLTTVVNNGVTIVNGDEINFAYTGTYMIEVTLNIANNITVDPVQVWLVKNGTNVAYTNHEVKVDTYSDPFTFSWLVTVTNPNDRFQIVWWSTDLTTKLQTVFITGPPSRPDVPSSSLNVWQVVYQGPGGALTSVVAGTNISVNNTNPVAPIVSIANPLTSALNGVSGGDNFSLSPTQLLIASGTQLTNTQTANNITLLNFIPGIGGAVGRVEAQADLGQAQLFLGCGVGTPGDQNTFRLTVAPSTGAIMEHETLVGTNRALTVRSEGPINLQAGYNDAGATTAQPITITSTGVGGQANPSLILTNTNAGTGLPGAGVGLEIYRNKPTAGTNGDTLFNQSVYGKDGANNRQEYTRITHSIRASASGSEDGSIEFGCFINGVNTNFLQINGNDEQVNILKPLDMTAQDIINVNKISINGATSFGVAGQHIISRGSGGSALWMNPSQTPPLANYGGGATIDDTTPYVMGCSTGQPTFAPAGSGATGRYKVDYSAIIEGINHSLVITSQLVYDGITYGGEIFNSGDWYVSEPLTKSGSTHHSISFSDYFTFPYVFGLTRTLQLEISVLTESGSGSTNDARITATITPCYS